MSPTALVRWLAVLFLRAQPSSVWAQLVDTTWFYDNGLSGEGYVFYEDAQHSRRCLHQVYGSGLAMVKSEWLPIHLPDRKHVQLGGVTFALEHGELVAKDFKLTLRERAPVVYGRTAPFDMKRVRSPTFTLDQLSKE